MAEREYVDIDILLERQGDGHTARVLDSPVGSHGPVELVVPSDKAISSLVAGLRDESVAVDVRAHRRIAPAAPAGGEDVVTPRAFGLALFRSLFSGPNLDVLRHSQHVVGKEKGLRLRLHFESSPELASVPWELLYDEDRHKFLCQYDDFSAVRVIESATTETPLRVDGPVRMLVVISSPTDLPPLDVDREWDRLVEAVGPLEQAGRLDVVPLPSATLDAVHEAVRNEEFHVLHFIGHGGVDETGEGVLAFMGEDGRAHRVPASVVRVVLSNSPFRLVVLNACEGGRTTALEPYASTAISLVDQGVPAVVAMQFEISDVAAIEFSRALYHHVLAGRSIDLAVTMARQKILIWSPEEWATPVLYLRSRTARLFVQSVPAGESVTPLEGTPVAEPPPVPERPHDVHGRVRGDTVELEWTQPEGGPDSAKQVSAWEVVRDQTALPVASQPRATDEKVPRGEHVYAVSALTAAGQRSGLSEPYPVVVRRRPPWGLVASLGVVMALLLVSLFSRGGSALAAPTNVRFTSAQVPVALAWDPAPEGSQVQRWEVLRDGLVVGTTTIPTFTDSTIAEVGHRYEVRAIGADGAQSPLSAPVTATATTTSTTTTSTSSTTTGKKATTTKTTTSVPVTEADLAVSFQDVGPGGGSGETALTFRIANSGPAGAKEVRVRTTMAGDGKIYDAQLRGGDGSSVPCEATTSPPFRATCAVGELAPQHDLTLVVTVAGDSYEVTVDVTSKDDPHSGNNRDSYVLGPTTPGSTAS